MNQQVSRVSLTAGRVDSFICPPGKSQAFLWDTTAPTLALRATPTGRKTFVFESRLRGSTVRVNIGTAADWPIKKAQARAHQLKTLIDAGTDPRELERQQLADKAAQAAAAAAHAMTVGEAWSEYLAQRKPHWGELNYRDHIAIAQSGGEQRKRSQALQTKAGPLAPLMPLRLIDLTPLAIDAWAAKEAKLRPARVRLALRLLKAFVRWAASEPKFKGMVDPAAASAKKTREYAGKPKTKNDYLQREQLPAWFEHVRKIPNPVIAAYLQCLLLTGARREELAALKWTDINFQWHGIDLKDKIEDRRAVPLTPYVESLITALPRRNEWVFSSVLALEQDDKSAARRARYHASKAQTPPAGDVAFRSASGRLIDPSIAHRKACAAAGLTLTLHGLRRSFASLCEWLDIPGGISAQIQGHAPQGVREQNYIRRPLDLLRVHHEKIEAWILQQAKVKFKAKPAGPVTVAARPTRKLRLVGTGVASLL